MQVQGLFKHGTLPAGLYKMIKNKKKMCRYKACLNTVPSLRVTTAWPMVCMYLCIYIYLCIHIVCMYVYLCIYVYIYIYVYMYIYISMYIYCVYVYIYIYIYIYCVYVYIYIYLCIYIYRYKACLNTVPSLRVSIKW